MSGCRSTTTKANGTKTATMTPIGDSEPSAPSRVVPASRPIVVAAPIVIRPCTNTSPVVVTENATGVRGDLCRPSLKAFSSLPYATLLAPGFFEVRVLLSKLEVRKNLKCAVRISITSFGSKIGYAFGSATVAARDRSAARDCVDAVIKDLVVRKVGPVMRHHVASLTVPTVPPPPARSPSSSTTSP